MNHDLVRYATGEVVPTKSERVVAKEAQTIYDKARLKALEADGRMALAAHLMEGVAKLDRKRKSLCHPEDQALNNMLSAIEVDAFNQVRNIQSGAKPTPPNDPWSF